MSKQPPKEKINKARFGQAVSKMSMNKTVKGKNLNLEEEKKKKPQIALLPSKNVNDIIDKIVKEGPKKLKRSNVSDISKMILGNLENVLGKAKKANIENLSKKTLDKKQRSDRNENYSDSEDTLTFSKRSGENSPKRLDIEKNPPPLRKLLNGKSEEEKNLISKKIKSMLNTPHEIKFVDEDAKKVYKKKVVKKLRGISPINKTQYAILKPQKTSKPPEEKAKEKSKKPVTEEQLLKRFVKNGMTLPNDKSERKKIIDCLWQTKRSLWKKRAQLIRQIEESSKVDLKLKELKDHGDQPSEVASVVKTYVVPDTVKAAKTRNNASLIDSVVYVEAKHKDKNEALLSHGSLEDYSEFIDKPIKTDRSNYGAQEKKFVPKVMSWNTKTSNKEHGSKVILANDSKYDNKPDTNKVQNKAKNRHTLLPNRSQLVKNPKIEPVVIPEIREHELLGREQLGVPEKAYKQIIQDVANFIKKEEKKIVQNLCEKYKEDTKQSNDEMNDKDTVLRVDESNDTAEKKNSTNDVKYSSQYVYQKSEILPSKPKTKKPQQSTKKLSQNVPTGQAEHKEKVVKAGLKKRASSRPLGKVSKTRLHASKNRKKPLIKSGNLKKKSKNAIPVQAKTKENVKVDLKGKPNRPKKTPVQQSKAKTFPQKEKNRIVKSVSNENGKNSTIKSITEQSSASNSELDLGTGNTNSIVETIGRQAKEDLQQRKAANAQRLRMKMMENKRVFAEMRKLQQGEPSYSKIYNSSPFG